MATTTIVKTLDMFKDRVTSLLPRVKRGSLSTLAFEGTEKTFHRCVVVTVSHSRHTDRHSGLRYTTQIACTGIRTALIRMQEQFVSWMATQQGHF